MEVKGDGSDREKRSVSTTRKPVHSLRGFPTKLGRNRGEALEECQNNSQEHPPQKNRCPHTQTHLMAWREPAALVGSVSQIT